MNAELAQRPGGGVRLLLWLSTLFGYLTVFAVGFPPAARDRLPLLALSLALTLLTAWNPLRGLRVLAFLFPLAGAGNRFFGGADAIAWPVLLFAAFAVGWTFRFLYDFESAAEPTAVDPLLRTLLAIWAVSAVLAVVSARTLWALLRGLSLRAVNHEGLLDAAAIRDTVMTFAVLASGAGFFFLLRRAGASARSRALSAALAGVGVSAAMAIAQRWRLAPAETSGFWKATGRLSGGAMDPNALGLLCGLAAVVALARLSARSGQRFRWGLLTALAVAGLVLSGSRSGLLVAGLGVALLIVAPGDSRRRLAFAALVAALVLAAAVVTLRGDSGTAGSRLAELLDPNLSSESRTSSRPLLWRSAVLLFSRHPVEGAGLAAFSWRLPDLAAEQGRAVPFRDNPGSAYLQALAETGAIGFALTVVFAVVLARIAWRDGGGAGAATAAFLVALTLGSHWLAPDVALLFFLLSAVAVPVRAEAARETPEPARAPSTRSRRLRVLLVAAYAVAAALSGVTTLRADAAFAYRQGIGFHEKELGAGGPFYWTERRFAIFLPPGRDLSISLAHFTPEGRGVELTAQAVDRPTFVRTLRPGESVSLRLTASPREPLVVRFLVSRAFIPKRLGLSADRRELGLVAVFPRAS